MFERIVDFFIAILDWFCFWTVLDEFEEGVVLTLGRPRQKRFLGLGGSYLLGPGFHFLWPFAIEEVLVDNVVPTTTKLDPQSLTTKDGKSIVISAVITWRIQNIERMLLKVEDAHDALDDVCCGAIGAQVEQATWDEICQPEWSEGLGKEVRKKAMKWGMRIEEVMLADKTKSLSFRLIQNSPVLFDEEE